MKFALHKAIFAVYVFFAFAACQTSLYNENFSFGASLGDLEFSNTSYWQLNTADHVMKSASPGGWDNISVTTTPVFEAKRTQGDITIEWRSRFPSDNTIVSWRENNKTFISLVDSSGNKLYQLLHKPNNYDDLYTSADLILEKYSSGTASTLAAALSHREAPAGDSAAWVSLRMTLAASGDITVSYDAADGNGMQQYISTTDNSYTDFTALQIEYKTGISSLNCFVEIDDISVTGTQSGGSGMAPTISAHPISQTVPAGAPVTLSVTAAGDPAPQYQWRKNGAAISGAQASAYEISAADAGDEGDYTCYVFNGAGNVTSNAATLTLATAATGQIYREYWTGITGPNVSNLTSSPDYPDNPSGGNLLTIFEGPVDWNDSYGARFSGYVHAPMTGSYTFWIASDNLSTLYLSTDDTEPNKVEIASVNSWTAPREWHKNDTQQSDPVTLISGQRYYIEALHKEETGSDNIAVGWKLPDGRYERPIPGHRLSAIEVAPQEAPQFTTQPSSVTRFVGESATFSVTATGNPTPLFEWFKNGVTTNVFGSEYAISSVALSDAGEYTCVATNSQGSATSTAAILTVNGQPTGDPISAVLECVQDNGGNNYTAYFGYYNPNSETVIIPVGAQNGFSYYGVSAQGFGQVTEFLPGRHMYEFSVNFDGNELVWRLNDRTATATGGVAVAQCIIPPNPGDNMLYQAFAFGADPYTRPVPFWPGAAYTKIVQGGANFLYTEAQGYGYTDIDNIDDSPNNRGVFDGYDEIYDQFIGVKGGEGKRIVFRIDVPNGFYRFVAAGGDAQYTHAQAIRARDGSSGDLVSLIERHFQEGPNNKFYAVGYEGLHPPAGDGGGTQPSFIEKQESPVLEVTQGYIEIHQVVPLGATTGGDLSLLEVWKVGDPTPAIEAQYYDWQYLRRIVFNTKPAGAGVAQPTADIPVLVKLTSANFSFTQAQAGGADIRFADPDGTVLPYYIEKWDESGGEALVWVRVPEIRGNSTEDYITMYWGNTSATTQSSGAAVFGPEKSVAVYDINSTSGTYYVNQTGNGVPADIQGSPLRGVTGQIGAAAAFNTDFGHDDLLSLIPTRLVSNPGAVSISAWIYPTTVGVVEQIIVHKRASEYESDYGLFLANDNNSAKLRYRCGNAIVTQTLDDVSLNTWHHVAVTHSDADGEVHLYLDGVMVIDPAYIPIGASVSQELHPYEIGGVSGFASKGFHGKIDHVQIDKVIRPAGFFKLQSAMAHDGQNTILLGPVQENPRTFEDIIAQATTVSAYVMDAVYEKSFAEDDFNLHHIHSAEGRIEMSQISGETRYLYITDHLGSTRMVIAEDGGISEAIMYTAYGEMSSVFPTAADPAREKFTGKEFDQEGADENGVGGIQAYYFGARFYDPEIGVWFSADAANQYWNGYGYPTNPVYYIDPDGNFSLAACVVAAIIGAAAGTVRGAMDAYNEGGDFWDYAGEIFVHSNIGGAAGFGGSAVGGFAGGGFLGGLAGGAAGGGSQALGDAVVEGQSADQVWDATWKGSVAGGVGGGVGGAVGNGVWGAMAGGFAGGATGGYLNGARDEEILYAGLIGAGVSAAAYGVQAGIRYSHNTGYAEFDNFKNRVAMSREAEKSFRWFGKANTERGGWLRNSNDPEIWAKGQRAGITPSSKPSGANGAFHTHPNQGSNWIPAPSHADISWTQNSARVNHFVISRHNVYLQPATGTYSLIGGTNSYLTAWTYNTFYFGY